MKLPHVALAIALALGSVSIAACNSSGAGKTVELPGGGPTEPERDPNAQSRNWFEQMLGRDNRPNAGPCPLMGALYDTSRQVQFNAPNQERYANITYTAEMQGVRGLCRYVDANPITMAMEVDMAFGRGPAATADRATYRYWVAVARRGRAPIEKQYFDVNVRFPRGQNVVTHTEQIERITIPRASAETSGENFEILVGFDLTPEQLQFNRDGKRFRVDAAQAAAGQQQQRIPGQ